MQKDKGFGWICAWGNQASWPLIEGVGAEGEWQMIWVSGPWDSSVDSGAVAAVGPLSQPEPYRFAMSPRRLWSEVVAGEVVVSVDRFAKAVKMPG